MPDDFELMETRAQLIMQASLEPVAYEEAVGLYDDFYLAWCIANGEKKNILDPRVELLCKASMQVATSLIDADDYGRIQPPLTNQDRSRLIARYVSSVGLIERHTRAVRNPDKQFGKFPRSR